MMDGQDFLRVIEVAFAPFSSELGFELRAPSICGKAYRADFEGTYKTVSVAYEPSDEALFVMVLDRRFDRVSDIDDRTKTPRLSDLNRRFMNTVSNEERSLNDAFFGSVMVDGVQENKLLKAAKELRLVLPKYLDASKSGQV